MVIGEVRMKLEISKSVLIYLKILKNLKLNNLVKTAYKAP
jgi:hypothetical protein